MHCSPNALCRRVILSPSEASSEEISLRTKGAALIATRIGRKILHPPTGGFRMTTSRSFTGERERSKNRDDVTGISYRWSHLFVSLYNQAEESHSILQLGIILETNHTFLNAQGTFF